MSISIKEQVVTESIERSTKRIAEIKAILEAMPLSRICELRIEAQKILKSMSTEELCKPENREKIEVLAKEEKKQFAIAQQQQNSIALIDEQVKLEMELSSLNGELWFIQNKGKL